MADDHSLGRDERRPADGQVTTVVTTSWDDGHIFDFAVANLLDQYELPGTFYIAPRNGELPIRTRLRDRHIAELATRFEVGGHTLTHLRLPRISDAHAANEIVAGRDYLESCTGIAVKTFCYPGGEYGSRHTRMVRDAGFELARTVERHRIDRPSSFMEVPTSFHAYRHLRDGQAALRSSHGDPLLATHYFLHWDAWAIALFERALHEGGVFHLWGHSWELEQRKDWGRLENVLAHISRRRDVTYVPNGDLVHLENRCAGDTP